MLILTDKKSWSFLTWVLPAVMVVEMLISAPVSAAETKNLRIAAAADLKFAMPALVEIFEKSHPDVKVETIIGSSGSFTQQIQASAPFDLFLSADDSYPTKLKAAKKVEGDVFRYGTGHLVLWFPNAVKLVKQTGQSTMAVLESSLVKKFAIANPAVAPYGRAAEEALMKAKLKDKLKIKMVMGENVAQAAQYAMTGAVEASLIAQALAESPEMKASGSYLSLGADEAPLLKQSGAVLVTSKLKKEAGEFRELLLGSEGQAVLAAHGLADVAANSKPEVKKK